MMYNGQVRLITENEVVTMKKKLLVVCMAFTMMFSFTACGKQETTETEAATEAGVQKLSSLSTAIFHLFHQKEIRQSVFTKHILKRAWTVNNG